MFSLPGQPDLARSVGAGSGIKVAAIAADKQFARDRIMLGATQSAELNRGLFPIQMPPEDQPTADAVFHGYGRQVAARARREKNRW